MKTIRCFHQIAAFAAIVMVTGSVALGAVSDAARMSSDMMNPGTPLRIKEHCCGGSFKVLFYGNSIAMHAPMSSIGWTNDWGMAASSAENDFVHLVVRGLEDRLGKKADWRIRKMHALELNISTNAATVVEIASDVAWGPDYVVIAIGENSPAINKSNAADYRRLLAGIARPFASMAKPPKIVMRSPFWTNPAKAECTAQAAADVDAVYVDAGPLGTQNENKAIGLFAHRGVANHPGDLGMRRLADLILTGFETAAIQDRIDDAWRRGGGTVEISSGVHKIGVIRLRSNVTLLLRSGAVLQASRNLAEYDGWVNDALEPVARPQPGDPNNYMRSWYRAVIRLHSATNAAIIGEPGSVIDGCNTFDPNGEEKYRGAHGIMAMYVTNCLFQGYTMRRAGNWAHHFRMGRNLHFRDLTIDAGHDGIHLRQCDAVEIANCRFRTGDDSVAGFGNSHVHVHDCDISSACSAFRFGGRHVLVEDCVVHGPCDYPFRGSLPREVKECGGEGASGEGRRNMLSLFTYFSMKGFGLKENAGDIVLRNIRVSGADRFLQYNYSGNEKWSTGVPMDGITFENVVATGIKYPLCAYGDAAVPLALALKNCRLSFAERQRELVRGANLKCIELSDVEVEGIDGGVLRNYGPEVKIRVKNLKGAKPSACKADEPFSVEAI